jgi:hypothetical protein
MLCSRIAFSRLVGARAETLRPHVRTSKLQCIGELLWKGVKLAAEGVGPETTDPVWLAPRDVRAAMLETVHGEREKFLFYRGVEVRTRPCRCGAMQRAKC